MSPQSDGKGSYRKLRVNRPMPIRGNDLPGRELRATEIPSEEGRATKTDRGGEALN